MKAIEINNKYLDTMLNAEIGKEPVLYRVKELWWNHFIELFEKDQILAINQLDLCMIPHDLTVLAENYAYEQTGNRNSDEFRQKVSQFLKSNTGKMFERFIGLAIAYYLKQKKSDFAIWPFRNDLNTVCPHLSKKQFTIECILGDKVYSTPLDGDLIIFSPENKEHDFYMISVKSTLKDRFHNVPFWNLLRVCAVNKLHNLSAKNLDILSRAKYVAVCTDLAKEQPDFASQGGPRNLLCLDAALLDGAYVTSFAARGLGVDNNHFGRERNQAFYPLNKFMEMLCDS